MKKIGFAVSLLMLFLACGTSKKTSAPESAPETTITEDDLFPSSAVANIQEPTKPSATRVIDVLHTKLEVSFNWEKQRLNGKASITLKPYFYPVSEIKLDAQNFDINKVTLGSSTGPELKFESDSVSITILPDKELTRKDTLTIFIDYLAKPNERKTNTGQAITSDKGLYFINPEGKDKNKPVQVWTQGEPESNSCWFPGIDKPNERMTHEILITLDSAHSHFTTLSNGLLLSSKKLPGGGRVDHWKQSLPAATYLVMMAVGEFAVVKDEWKGKEVSYYMEPEYKAYAKNIYGNTPEMIEFFSKKTGVEYPWEKYAQVAVRDYVSGAMENTTAVIFGEFMNQTPREMLDQNFEDVISHELFHHWFGDLVTCENWTDLTLNEGFATYGEYLWREHKYGREYADELNLESLSGYLASGLKNPKKLVRKHYDRPDEMFDENSYNKGGAVLHMLRKYVGDEAFFQTLQIYLDRHKYSPVESHQLRLVFEEVTGEDLNWFFQQWFYSKGYPELQIRHNYSDSLKTYYLFISQTQDLNEFPVFRIPLDVDFYSQGKVNRKRIWINGAEEEFSFPVNQKPDLVNVDAEKSLVGTRDVYKAPEDWAFQYRNAPLYLDRLDALKNCAKHTMNPDVSKVIIEALEDKSSEIREKAIAYSEKLNESQLFSSDSLVAADSSLSRATLKNKIEQMALSDKKSMVRARALRFLNTQYPDDDLSALYLKLIKDSSYYVASSALSAYAKSNKEEALKEAVQFENAKSKFLLLSVASVYSQYGSEDKQAFFEKLAGTLSGWEYLSFVNIYGVYLKRCNDETVQEGLKVLQEIADKAQNRWIQNSVGKVLKNLKKSYSDKESSTRLKLESVPEGASGDQEREKLNNELQEIKTRIEEMDRQLDAIASPTSKN